MLEISDRKSENRLVKASIDNPSRLRMLFDEYGYVEATGVLSLEEISKLHTAFDEGVESKQIKVSEFELASSTEGNDAVFKHPFFLELAKHPRIRALVESVIGPEFELQHSKLNCKPLKDQGRGLIQWHQDFPFFPHTNYDLVAVSIHFDDEDENSGPIRFIPGSHKRGVLSHAREQHFAYEIPEHNELNHDPSVLMTGPAGRVMVHHCLTIHKSDPKRSSGQRRILVLQYRATDCVQLAGVIWKCTGMPIQSSNPLRYARFPDGSRVELRGSSGRLFDLFGKLAPDKKPS